MNRQQKIALLEGLASGKRSLKDILPPKIIQWEYREGMYYADHKSKPLTEQEFEELEDDRNIHLIFVRPPGI